MSSTFIIGLIILLISVLVLISQLKNLSYYPMENKKEVRIMSISGFFILISGAIIIFGS